MTGEIEWSYKTNARDCGQELPVAKATRPAPEWRITPVTAPLLPPPPRVTTTPARAPPPSRSARRRRLPAASQRRNARRRASRSCRQRPAPARAAAAARARCRLGMSPAPLLVDGAVVTGTPQGMLRIFDGATGEVLFEYMTNREFPETVSGVPGHGGGLDSAPYVAGDGTLFVQSGYARFGEPPAMC